MGRRLPAGDPDAGKAHRERVLELGQRGGRRAAVQPDPMAALGGPSAVASRQLGAVHAVG